MRSLACLLDTPYGRHLTVSDWWRPCASVVLGHLLAAGCCACWAVTGRLGRAALAAWCLSHSPPPPPSTPLACSLTRPQADRPPDFWLIHMGWGPIFVPQWLASGPRGLSGWSGCRCCGVPADLGRPPSLHPILGQRPASRTHR